MARINTNPPALLAISQLGRNYGDLQTSIERLASGLRILNAGDDPGGLMISEQLANEEAGVRKAIENTESGMNFLATAEAALDEISQLLNDIRTNMIAGANRGSMTPEEINASQLLIDSAVQSIDRIANATEFAGIPLLDGNRSIQTRSVPAEIDTVRAYRADFPNQQYSQIRWEVTQPATPAVVTSKIQNPAAGATIRIVGPEGSHTVNLAAQPTAQALAAAVADAVNGSTDITGVFAQHNDASLASDGATVLNTDPTLVNYVTVDQGSNFRVSVEFTDPNVVQTGVFDFPPSSRSAHAHGTDIQGTINDDPFIGNGNVAITKGRAIDLEVLFQSNLAAGTSGTFDLVRSGSTLQIGGEINSSQTLNFGIPSVTSSNLGLTRVGGAVYSLNDIISGGNFTLANSDGRTASAILDQAIQDVSVLRGRLGAVQRNTLESNMNSLQVALENIVQSGSTIRDTDFAAETAALSRSEILVQAATSVLATANSVPRQVIQLLTS